MVEWGSGLSQGPAKTPNPIQRVPLVRIQPLPPIYNKNDFM